MKINEITDSKPQKGRHPRRLIRNIRNHFVTRVRRTQWRMKRLVIFQLLNRIGATEYVE
jgi:hypothetical protein